MTATAKIKYSIISIIIFLLIFGTLSCSGNKGTATPAVTPSVAAGATVTPTAVNSAAPKVPAQAASSPKTSISAKASVVPKLTDVSFTLALEKGQDYTENTTPIYLKASQILHLNWLVAKGGNYFYMTITLPTGVEVAVCNDGGISNYVAGESSIEKLTKSGDMVFNPTINDWTDGYYLFHPQIYKNDSAVTVKFLYWIDG